MFCETKFRFVISEGNELDQGLIPRVLRKKFETLKMKDKSPIYFVFSMFPQK